MRDLPADVAPCVYRSGHGKRICFCKHPQVGSRQAITYDKCRECTVSLAVPTSLPKAQHSRTCRHIGSLHSLEPCKCGSISKVRVFECNTDRKVCVLTEREAKKIKDSDSRRYFLGKTCQGCPLFEPRATDGPIRVGLITPCWAIGGVERWLLTLAKYSRNIHWQGVALMEASSLTDGEAIHELNEWMPITFDRRSLVEKCDIVLIWVDDAYPELSNFRGRVVHVVHGATDWSRQCAERNSRITDHFIAVGALAAECCPLQHSNTIIQNAPDPERLVATGSREFLRDRYGISESETAVVYVGRWSSEKNPELAAIAAAEIGGVAVYCSQTKGGTTDWQQKVKRLCPRAVFVPSSRPGDAFTIGDAFVQGCQHEPSGIVFLESWHCRIPVVSHATGVVPLAEQLAGCQLTERILDHRSIGSAVLAAISHPERIAVAADTVRRHFAPEKQASEYERVFRALLSEHRAEDKD